jgi:uncharacterized protein YpmB
MNEQEWIVIIGVIVNGIISIIAAFYAIRAKYLGEANKVAIQEVHVATNSMKDALVKASSEAAFAAGKTEERTNPEPRPPVPPFPHS